MAEKAFSFRAADRRRGRPRHAAVIVVAAGIALVAAACTAASSGLVAAGPASTPPAVMVLKRGAGNGNGGIFIAPEGAAGDHQQHRQRADHPQRRLVRRLGRPALHLGVQPVRAAAGQRRAPGRPHLLPRLPPAVASGRLGSRPRTPARNGTEARHGEEILKSSIFWTGRGTRPAIPRVSHSQSSRQGPRPISGLPRSASSVRDPAHPQAR